jgi:hypothetical protein
MAGSVNYNDIVDVVFCANDILKHFQHLRAVKILIPGAIKRPFPHGFHVLSSSII